MSHGYKKFCNICLIFSFTETYVAFPLPLPHHRPTKNVLPNIHSGYLFLPERTMYISDFRVFLTALQIYFSFFIYSQNIHQVNKWYYMTSTVAGSWVMPVRKTSRSAKNCSHCRYCDGMQSFFKNSRVTDNFKFFSLSNWKDGFSVH